MASSVSGSSTVNGLYSNANKISGLVSGLDTESMIEGLVDSYNMKIIGFQQSVVQQQWKQEAYRGVVSDLLAFSEKYTSFSSQSTNLSSNSFWNSATQTQSTGSNSDKVSVSGSTTSSVTIDSVLQTATSNRVVSSQLSDTAKESVTDMKSETVDLTQSEDVGTLNGNLTFTFDSTKVTVSFSNEEVYKTDKELVDAINQKLADQDLNDGKATDYFSAELDSDGNIVFKTTDKGNTTTPYISGATGTVKTALNITTASDVGDAEAQKITLESEMFDDEGGIWKNQSNLDTIAGQNIYMNYNGTVITMKIPTTSDLESDKYAGMTTSEAIVASLNEQISAKFGSAVEVKNGATGDNELALEFVTSGSANDSIIVSSGVGETLGFGGISMSNALRTSDTLGSLLADGTFGSEVTSTTISQEDMKKNDVHDILDSLNLGENQGLLVANGNITTNSDGFYVDSDGDKVVKVTGAGLDGEDAWVKLDYDEEADSYSFKVGEKIIINGTTVGVFDSESTIDDVVNAVNSADAGVSLSFSTITNNFVFSSTQTGSTSKIVLNDTKLGSALFGATDENGDALPTAEGEKSSVSVQKGTDAVILATINGEQVELVRNTNTISIEGLSVTVNGTFNNVASDGTVVKSQADIDALDEGVSVDQSDSVGFEDVTNFDTIIETVAQMVLDYNELMSNIKTLFTEVPLYTSTGSKYLPLTDEDANSMTESAVASYEEKAKTGLLFGDSNIRSLYNSMSSMFSATGPFGMDLYEMGFDNTLGQSASKNVVDFDPEKFQAALEKDFDKVKTAFTSSTVTGGSANGLMASMKAGIDKYASVTGATKGILVDEAGHEDSATSLLYNNMQEKIDAFQKLITTWEEKLADKVDYYTAQFTRLEVLMANANSQMSAISGLNTGY